MWAKNTKILFKMSFFLCVCFTYESKSYSFGRAVELLKKIMGSAKTRPRVL